MIFNFIICLMMTIIFSSFLWGKAWPIHAFVFSGVFIQLLSLAFYLLKKTEIGAWIFVVGSFIYAPVGLIGAWAGIKSLRKYQSSLQETTPV
jgi:uncharacterized MnhB-related membrane protein